MSDYGDDYGYGYDHEDCDDYRDACDPNDYEQDAYYDEQDDVYDYDPRDQDDGEDDVEDLVALLETLTIGKEYRRYGFYKCPECSKKWQSAYVYCEYKGKENDEDVFEAKSKQACKDCNVMVLPHSHNRLKKPANTDNTERKGHRADLCERCIKGIRCRAAS